MVPRRVLHTWLRPEGEMRPWIDALRELDLRGNKAPLIKLLRDKRTSLPNDARWHVADALERFQLNLIQGGRGGRRTPSYDLSMHVAQLDAATKSVRRAVKDGMSLDEAVSRKAEHYGVDEEALRSDLAGKHTGA